MREFKKCPMCGNAAYLDVAVTGIGDELVYRMICCQCGLSTRPIVSNGFSLEAEKKCIESWENRVER